MTELKNENSKTGKLLAKPGVMPVLFISCLVAILFYLLTFFPFYFITKLVLIHSVPFLVNYVLFYLVILILILFIFILVYRHKIANLKSMDESILILGFDPVSLVKRTGMVFIDKIGFLISTGFFISSLIISKLHFLLPFFLLCTIAFLFAIISGDSKPWELKRR